MPAQLTWLLLEGMLPLMGAGAIYLAWGACRYIVTMEGTHFAYDWTEAADPVGWLYGAFVIAVQSAIRCFSTSGDRKLLASGCIVGGVFCFFLLLAAMSERGAISDWKPSALLRRLALGLVVCILFGGYLAHIPVTAP